MTITTLACLRLSATRYRRNADRLCARAAARKRLEMIPACAYAEGYIRKIPNMRTCAQVGERSECALAIVGCQNDPIVSALPFALCGIWDVLS